MLQKLGKQAQLQRSVVGMKLWVGWVGLSVAVGVAYFLAAQLGLALLTVRDARGRVLACFGHRCGAPDRARTLGARARCGGRDRGNLRRQPHG